MAMAPSERRAAFFCCPFKALPTPFQSPRKVPARENMLLVRATDAKRARVPEIKKWILAHGGGSGRGRTRGRKSELIQHMREIQAKRIIARRVREQARGRAGVPRAGAPEEKHAARQLQRWWRSVRRLIPVNPHDPITLTKWSEVDDLEGECFSVVTRDGVVYRYEADPLFQMMHQACSPVEPMCRYALCAPELRRLDRRVSGHLLRENGSCVSLLGDSGHRRRRRRKVVLELTSCLENTLDALCVTLDNIMQVARVTGPENRSRLVLHMTATQSEFISIFSQLCAVDCTEAVSYTAILRKEQVRNMELGGPQERSWRERTLGLMDFCMHHSGDMARGAPRPDGVHV